MDAWSCVVLRKLGFKTTQEGKAVTIPKVEMERCDNCGETFLTPAGSRYVDDLNKETDKL
jgi:hypothetical protein